MRFSRIRRWILAVVSAVIPGCGLVTGSTDGVVHPRFENGGLLVGATPLNQTSAGSLEGLWNSTEGSSLLGSSLVVHNSPGYISVFGNRDATYAVLQAGCLENGQLVLEGYHRTAINSDTGLVRLFVEPLVAAQSICKGQAPDVSIQLVGTYGSDNDDPNRGLTLVRQRDLPATPTTLVVAHRGGCRSSDDCGASENSLEILKMAQRLGADRVEVDVQVTSDGVPILFHDADFGPLLTSGSYCRGAVSDFTWAHVTQLCSLIHGESVPQLDDALRTVVENTQLVGLWLDVKTPAGMNASLPLVRKWNQIAQENGRNLRIVIGLSTEELVDAWLRLTSVDDLDCLVELEVSDLHRTGCRVWAPRWTLGTMAATVSEVRAEGRSVAFWTLDEEPFIDLFIDQAHPTGLLTNRPGLVLQRSYWATIRSEGDMTP